MNGSLGHVCWYLYQNKSNSQCKPVPAPLGCCSEASFTAVLDGPARNSRTPTPLLGQLKLFLIQSAALTLNSKETPLPKALTLSAGCAEGFTQLHLPKHHPLPSH